MTTYTVIDGYADVVMGVVDAESPTDAVRIVYQKADPHRDFSAERELIQHPDTWGQCGRSKYSTWGAGGVCYDNCAFVEVGGELIAIVEMRERHYE